MIRGPQGSGKTTLANVPDPPPQAVRRRQVRLETLRVLPARRDARFRPSRKAQGVRRDVIEKLKPGEYGHILIDDLAAETWPPALQLYEEAVSADRIIFLFLVSRDPTLLAKDQENSKVNIRVYETAELRPKEAVAFVRRRVKPYRGPG